MKSMYFAIKTLSNEKRVAKASEEMTANEFKGIFIDICKEAIPISEDEYNQFNGE